MLEELENRVLDIIRTTDPYSFGDLDTIAQEVYENDASERLVLQQKCKAIGIGCLLGGHYEWCH